MSAAPRSYSTQKVAERLGVSIQTVQRWVDAGHLRAWKTLGGHRRIDADSAEQPFKVKTSARGASGAEALRVLVVDDNTDDGDILAHLVTQAVPDAQLTLADNGFGGLVSIGQWQPHVLITALVMPHMDGLEMLRHLTRISGVAPRHIVAVTSHSADDLARRGPLPAGVALLTKPIARQAFIDWLQEAQRQEAARALSA